MTIGFSSPDLNSLVADLRSAPRVTEAEVRVIVQKSAADIKRDAQIFAPVDTGFLRGSITYRTWVESDAVVGEIGPTAEYGEYVELGTESQAPAAFMGPAFDRNAIYFEKAIGQAAGL